MHFLTYILCLPVIRLVSLLPYSISYFLSDILCFFFYKILKYRLKTVQKNLKLVFPKKSHKELKMIESKFYSHFTDITLESIMAYGMNKKQMEERYKYKNIEVLLEMQKKNKNIILLCGHYSNFEWLLSIGYAIKGNGYGVYTPLSNKYFDNLFKKIRKKHEAYLISRYEINNFMKDLDKNRFHLFGFAGDQSPRKVGKSYITNFLGKKVPVFTGAERFSKENKIDVVFADVIREKRGYYKTTFTEIKNIKDSEYGITDNYLRLLENQIYREPYQYLWSHNRFKHLIN